MTGDSDNYGIDEGTKLALKVMGAMHNDTTAALEGVLRNFCIEARRRQAIIALTQRKITMHADSETLHHPIVYVRDLTHTAHEVEDWLDAHYDGDWRDYTTRFNQAGF